ncbi:MAG: hypothetical protein AB7O65_10535 [Candidatus Korobacteraceae bacterium]
MRFRSWFLLTALLLLSSLSFAQSLGEVARTQRAARKTATVVTNEDIPKGSGPANGAAIPRLTKETVPADHKAENIPATAPQAGGGDRENELRNEISRYKNLIAEIDSHLGSEPNDAKREVMLQVLDDYQRQMAKAQQDLEGLSSPAKALKNSPENK